MRVSGRGLEVPSTLSSVGRCVVRNGALLGERVRSMLWARSWPVFHRVLRSGRPAIRCEAGGEGGDLRDKFDSLMNCVFRLLLCCVHPVQTVSPFVTVYGRGFKGGLGGGGGGT